MNSAPQPAPEPQRRSVHDGWTVLEYSTVPSTNLVAATLPAWHAVRADTQTAGRGRFQRAWVSDSGGLWLSAVLPTERGEADWRLLPLAAGLAVCDALRTLGAAGLRMRWPNDILAGERKLCGLLLDQFAPGRTVVGIGMNVRNRPESADPRLCNQAARLADLLPQAPGPGGLTGLFLSELRNVHGRYLSGGLPALAVRVNELWGQDSLIVELELDGAPAPRKMRGRFAGVDDGGRLKLVPDHGAEMRFEPQEVRHLTEIKSLP